MHITYKLRISPHISGTHMHHEKTLYVNHICKVSHPLIHYICMINYLISISIHENKKQRKEIRHLNIYFHFYFFILKELACKYLMANNRSNKHMYSLVYTMLVCIFLYFMYPIVFENFYLFPHLSNIIMKLLLKYLLYHLKRVSLFFFLRWWKTCKSGRLLLIGARFSHQNVKKDFIEKLVSITSD